MLKFILLLTCTFAALAPQSDSTADIVLGSDKSELDQAHIQHYLSFNDNKIYDVEIIVFAYQQELPNYKTYSNKTLFDDSTSLTLQPKAEDLPFWQITPSKDFLEDENINPDAAAATQYTVAIADDKPDKQVLAWFLHETQKYQLSPIWQKLSRQQHIKPLLHQAWRQVAGSFDDPIYVKINNLPNTEENATQLANPETEANHVYIGNNQQRPWTDRDNDSTKNLITVDANTLTQRQWAQNPLNAYEDYTVTGMVALSQGRFLHFGHQLNLIRHYTDENNTQQSMVFSLVERKQVKTGELHYFDSPWFGSIVKISQYLADDAN